MQFQELLTELMLRFNKFANDFLEFRKLWVDETFICVESKIRLNYVQIFFEICCYSEELNNQNVP